MPKPLHPFPLDPRLAQPAEVAGVVVGDGHVDRLGRFQPAFRDEPGQVLGDVRDLQAVIQSQLRVEDLKVLVAVGAAGDELGGARLFEGGDVQLGLFDRLVAVAHLVGPAAAAELLVPGDRHVDSGFLE